MTRAVGEQSLPGRRVAVTGAATGIGSAAVSAFLDAGARVVGFHHRSPHPAELKGECDWVSCDARDPGSVEAAFAEATDHLGGLDVLIAAAGVWLPGTPDTLTTGELTDMLDTNLRTTVLTNQAAYTRMRGQGGGQIVNLGSSEGVKGNPAAPHYAAAKAAVHAWTRSAAAAWGRDGVTVNAVAPAVATPGVQRLLDHIGPDDAAALERRLDASMPLRGALGDAREDLGPVLVFLGSPGAGFMTGQLVSVDGGLLMQG